MFRKSGLVVLFPAVALMATPTGSATAAGNSTDTRCVGLSDSQGRKSK